jgi:hypothetical protein
MNKQIVFHLIVLLFTLYNYYKEEHGVAVSAIGFRNTIQVSNGKTNIYFYPSRISELRTLSAPLDHIVIDTLAPTCFLVYNIKSDFRKTLDRFCTEQDEGNRVTIDGPFDVGDKVYIQSLVGAE